MEPLPKKLYLELFKYVPRLVTDGVVVNKKNEVLLVKRKNPPFVGEWCLPGGFVKKGDTTEATVEREVFEETGIRAKIVNLSGVYSDPKRDPRGHIVTVAYLMKPINSEKDNTKTKDSSETSSAIFVQLKKLPKLITDHNKIVADAIKILNAI